MSRMTVRLASSIDSEGSRPKTGPITSGGTSSKGAWVRPAACTWPANDSGAATRTS